MTYSKHLGPSLQEALDSQLRKTRSEQVELYEELGMTRLLATDIVKMWAALTQAGKFNESLPFAALMQDTFERISKIANSISVIEARASDEINIHTLNGIVAQITSLFYEVCGREHAELAHILSVRIRDEIVLPAVANKGTDITPDQTVLDMDETIPDE